METITITGECKKERYDELLPQISALLADESDLIANLANVSAALKTAFNYYSWVGFYLLKNEELVLGPFQGKVACGRIPLGKGVCGTAALRREAVIVPDVTKFPGHIACEPDSRSEIVVPMIRGMHLCGVIDIDSHDYDSFDQTDRIYLEKIAEIVSVKF
jgi:L-methionine (R)-S-oxide reductase